jgi:DNA-directed RNA polymerase subunit RPC12/RpoP
MGKYREPDDGAEWRCVRCGSDVWERPDPSGPCHHGHALAKPAEYQEPEDWIESRCPTCGVVVWRPPELDDRLGSLHCPYGHALAMAGKYQGPEDWWSWTVLAMVCVATGATVVFLLRLMLL